MKLTYIPDLPYPPDERKALDELKSLFVDWRSCFNQAQLPFAEMSGDGLVWDGFFPYYFRQPIRLLFVGVEGRELEGHNYVQLQHRSYQKGDNGFQKLNKSAFNRRQLRVAYGLIHGQKEWPDIPKASDIAPTVGEESGISFACMNISKTSNESDSSNANWPVIKATCGLSVFPRNFIEEEVAILRPHVVIAMNLEQLTDVEMGGLGDVTWNHKATTDHLGIARLRSLDHEALLLHTHHFASRMGDVEPFWEPIRDAVGKYHPITSAAFPS